MIKVGKNRKAKAKEFREEEFKADE